MTPAGQGPPQKQNLEDTFQAFMQSQQTINAQIAQNTVDIKSQLGELTTTIGALQHERGFKEFVYNEPCPICFSHSHLVTECYRAYKFPEFVHKHVYTTQGCMNPSSNNSHSYTHNNKWKTYANFSWTQEPWLDDVNTSYFPSHYIVPSEQPYLLDYLLLHQKNPNFEDSMWQKLAKLEIQVE